MIFADIFAENIFDMISAKGIEVIDITVDEVFNRSVMWDILTKSKTWTHHKNYIVACREMNTEAILQKVLLLEKYILFCNSCYTLDVDVLINTYTHSWVISFNSVFVDCVGSLLDRFIFYERHRKK